MYISYINIRARFYKEFSFKNVFLTNRRFSLKEILSFEQLLFCFKRILFKYFTEMISNVNYLLLSKLMSSKRSLFKSNLNVRLLPRSLEICWIVTVSMMYKYLSVISGFKNKENTPSFVKSLVWCINRFLSSSAYLCIYIYIKSS